VAGRVQKLQPNEFSGNTFTVSNLRMMDIGNSRPSSILRQLHHGSWTDKEVVVKKAMDLRNNG
jgi:pyruvate/2-oxoglutarate dehydrogenase complex dihydrolipoamide acyltransferase (E2) component